MRRTYRELDDVTKQRISQSLRGRGKSESHKEAISAGMRAYWAGIPHKEDDGEKNKEDGVWQ